MLLGVAGSEHGERCTFTASHGVGSHADADAVVAECSIPVT